MAKICKVTFGEPEKITPIKYKCPSKTKIYDECSYPTDKIKFKIYAGGCALELPLEDEEIFGFGLQLKSVCHRGTKKTVRANSDPLSDSGDSHAPVPFFVTNRGYGIYVDTARYASFHCGVSHVQHHEKKKTDVVTTTEELYAARKAENSVMMIEIPVASGVDIYIIEGDSIMDIVSEYNMFSGGGCMPPLWGLGVLYRCYTKSDENQILGFADYFRDNNIPCDIIGIEPGWQSRAYSCSFVWNEKNFPAWKNMINTLKGKNFEINLWEHAFVNGESPMYEELKPYAGDFEVWEGLVPDFAGDEASEIFTRYHDENFVSEGISGFKLDECDSSDFKGGWSFPNSTQFPSGADGEQMHSLFGILYQKSLMKSLGNVRTFSEVRNSGAFAAPYPFVLYSDLYDHNDFIRGVINSGFTGLLWAPELRSSNGKSDMIRRLQTVVFSHQVVLNQWNQEVAPWIKWDAVDETRKVLNLRMSLIPYLYSAYYTYYKMGKPPIRALVCDFEDDYECYAISDQYMFGDSMLIAPMTEQQSGREVYLPKGRWYDLWTNETIEGGRKIYIESNNIPVYVRDNSIVPWAKPVQYISKDTVFEITLKCFGKKGKTVLIQDDGVSCDTKYETVEITFENKKTKSDLSDFTRYKIVDFEYI